MAKVSSANIEAQFTDAVDRYGRWLKRLIVLTILYSIVLHGLWRPLTIVGVDYGKHWDAARAVIEGRSTHYGGDLWLGFNYPQATALAFFWLGYFTRPHAEHIWKMMLLAMLAVSWWIAWRGFRPTEPKPDQLGPIDYLIRQSAWRHWGLCAGFTVATFLPATSSLYLGNIDPLNALLVMMTAGCLIHGKDRAGGFYWALLTLVKIMPGVLIVPVLLWRRWRVLQGFLLAMAIYFFILLATGRLEDEWSFVRDSAPVIPSWWRYISSCPFWLAVKLIGRNDLYENPMTYLIGSRTTLAMLCLIYVGVLAWMRRRGASWPRILDFAIVYIPILSPLIEYHHFAWALAPLIYQASLWASGRIHCRDVVILLVGWFLLISARNIDVLPARYSDWAIFLPLVGFLIIAIQTVLTIRRTFPGRPPTSPEPMAAIKEPELAHPSRQVNA